MKSRLLVAAAMASLLAACGGGGSGGVGSTPPPLPAPTPTPTPTNTTMTDLRQSQSFINDAAGLSGTWDTTTGTAIENSAGRRDLTISFDASTGAYTVGTAGRSVNFSNANVTSEDEYDRVYTVSGEGGTDYLTLVKRPYSGAPQTQYVALGFWQRNSLSGSTQDTQFATFTYGLPTASAAVPRAGSAAYAIDVFGLVSAPGEEPASFQGQGEFSVDFLGGIFTTQANLTEYSLVSDRQGFGGGIELRASGNLSSSNGTFSGNAIHGSFYGQSSGTIEGRFYGPSGQELGASFQTGSAGGLSAVGSLIGRQDGSLVPAQQRLTNLTREQQFTNRYAENTVGFLTWINAETFDFVGYSSDMGGGRFTINEKVAGSDPNFTTYNKFVESVYGDQDVVLRLYKPGSANTELALTYASFGHWAGTRAGVRDDAFFTYGFETGQGYLAARTGTARYEGVAYGSGLSADASASYDVKGTSQFDINFGSQTFGGALTLAGVERTTGANRSFGSFDIAGALAGWDSALSGGISRGGAPVGNFFANFFGPNAEELAGTFWIHSAATSGMQVGIEGATVAARK